MNIGLLRVTLYSHADLYIRLFTTKAEEEESVKKKTNKLNYIYRAPPYNTRTVVRSRIELTQSTGPQAMFKEKTAYEVTK